MQENVIICWIYKNTQWLVAAMQFGKYVKYNYLLGKYNRIGINDFVFKRASYAQWAVHSLHVWKQCKTSNFCLTRITGNFIRHFVYLALLIQKWRHKEIWSSAQWDLQLRGASYFHTVWFVETMSSLFQFKIKCCIS